MLNTCLTGKQRVLNILEGRPVDKQPLFETIRNDAVIEYFAGEKLTYDNAPHVVRLAHARAVDATRMLPKLPVPPALDTLPDGRKVRYERWMRWAEPKRYDGFSHYEKEKTASLNEPILSEIEKKEVQALISEYARCEAEYFSGIFFLWSFGVHDKRQFGVCSRSLQGYFLTDLYEEIGFETFCSWLYQAPELFTELLERQFQKSIAVFWLPCRVENQAPCCVCRRRLGI